MSDPGSEAAARLDAISQFTEVLVGMRKQLVEGGFTEDAAEDMVKLFAEKISREGADISRGGVIQPRGRQRR